MARNHTGDLVVRPRFSSPVRTLLAVGAGVVLVLIGVGLYFRGLSMAGFDHTAATQNDWRLRERIHQLAAENRLLRQSLAVAERSVQMDQAAYHDLNVSLKRSARQITTLQERVDLYAAILSPPTPLQGVTIERLDLRRTSGGHYRYALIMVQPLEARGMVYGTLRFKIQGSSGDKPAESLFPPLVDKPVPVHFKYFQDIEGVLDLPAGFSPRVINVDVRTQGRRIRKTFQWRTQDP